MQIEVSGIECINQKSLFLGMKLNQNFKGARVVILSVPPRPLEKLLALPTSILRYFWKDSLMTPTLIASFTVTPSPSTNPYPLKVLIVHLYL